MDIINYSEVNKLENHMKNRIIQESLLNPNTVEWALSYDKENLGKNLAIAYGLNVSQYEQYKNLEQLQQAEGNIFVTLGRINLGLAEMFYDKILPFATQKSITMSTSGTQTIVEGNCTLLKYRLSGDGNANVRLGDKVEGNYNLPNTTVNSTLENKCINKMNSIKIYRDSGCSHSFTYKVWYI